MKMGAWAVVAAVAMGGLARGTSLIPSQPEYVKDLAGEWRFKLEQKAEVPAKGRTTGGPEKFMPPAKLEAFEKVGYVEGPEWKGIRVPGNWEMEGWSVATYNQPDNCIGLYRVEVEVPKEWEGRVVKIDFDGVQNGAEVYCNGRAVKVDESTGGKENYHQGGNDAFQADLTPAVKFGGKNVLAVRVYKNPEGVDLDTGDFFFLGGIHRRVTLFSVPAAHVQDLTVKTTVSGGGKADVSVGVKAVGEGMSVEAGIEGLVKPTELKDGKGEWHVDGAEYWSAEKPKLYDLRVELKDAGGKVVEVVKRRVGIREVTIEGGVMMVNHVPVKLTGMCRHEVWPTKGTACDDEVWRKDVSMMKAANVNAIRTSHYPYGAGFYDVCDELGMYVMDEMAAGWVPTDVPRLTPFFAQHAREMVRRDKNHACVITWAIGNENKPGMNNKVAAEEIRKLDDTRPRLVSWRKAEEGGVELDDLHYTNPDAIKRANEDVERRKKYPITYLENPNDWEARNGADWGCLDAWGEVIKRTWDVVWEADHVPGSFLWEWADRAVSDPNEVHLFDFDPKTGINLVKVKGQVDAYRNPRPGLFHVKMTYAPVKVDLVPVVEGDSVVVHVRNWYSFTDLKELKTTWTLVGGGKDLTSGVAAVALPPRSMGDLRFELPKGEVGKAEALRVAFEAADGRNVATYELRLKPAGESGPVLAGAEGVKFPRFNLVTSAIMPDQKTGWKTAKRERATLRNVRVGGKEVADEKALEGMALSAVSGMEAEVMMGDEMTGKLHAAFDGGKFSYRLDWATDKGNGDRKKGMDVQELGWVFAAAAGENQFSWERKGLWSWYPADHIGRLRGTARPDSMEQDVTRITRADAFDYGATKYGCEWATLADDKGRGLGVRFGKGYQVKAGVGGELVVNLWCCPPRDLSSGVVPDLYFTLEKGKVVEGDFSVGRVGVR